MSAKPAGHRFARETFDTVEYRTDAQGWVVRVALDEGRDLLCGFDRTPDWPKTDIRVIDLSRHERICHDGWTRHRTIVFWLFDL